MIEQSLVTFFLILILISFIGFSISLSFCKISLLKRVLLSPIIGYSIISLITAYFSHAGLGTNQIALSIFVVLIIVSTIILILKRKNIADNECLSLKFLIPVTIFGLASAAILLAPTVLEHAPYLFNDHTTYISISEYLKDFGYSIPTQRDVTFWHDNTWQYQSMHLRMGAQFFVAFFAALLPIAHTISIYPSILGLTAFIFMCSIGFLYLSLRKEKSTISEAFFVLFFSFIAINLSSQNLALGFLPQTLGIILFVILSALAYEVFYSGKKHYVLISILFATLVFTYHEITLFYGAGIFVVILFEYFYKKNRNYQLFVKFILAHVLALVLSLIGTKEFILGIYSSAKTNDVGWNVPYSLLRYVQMLFGQDIHYVLPSGFYRWFTIPGIFMTFFYIYVLLKRRFWGGKKEISQFLLAVFSPFLVAIGIFAYLKYDPFTHHLGHTWRIFKLVSWSYWIIPIIIGMAIFSYFKENRVKKMIVTLSIIFILPSIGWSVYMNYTNHKYEMELYTGNYKDPLNDFKCIAENKKKYSPANIIDYQSHPNYPYLILSILKDISTGDLNIFGNQLVPSTKNTFYTWINTRREHDNTEEPLITKAGFSIYPRRGSSVYLFDGFSQRETYDKDHLAWLTSKNGTIKVVVPEEGRVQFSTLISNWQDLAAHVTITLNEKILFSLRVGTAPIKFNSPVLGEGIHQFFVKYDGVLRTPDARDGRALGLMFKNTNIVSVK